jgi:hypothetical protein
VKNAQIEREHRENERDESDPEPDIHGDHVAENYLRRGPRGFDARSVVAGFRTTSEGNLRVNAMPWYPPVCSVSRCRWRADIAREQTWLL